MTESARFRPFELVSPGFSSTQKPVDRPSQTLVLGEQAPEAPFVAVELTATRVHEHSPVIAAGLATTDGDHLLGTYDAARSRLTLEVRRSGRTRTMRRKTMPLPEEFGLAVVVCELRMTLLIDTGAGWEPVLTERGKVADAVDLRRPEVLETFRPAWGLRPGRAAADTETAETPAATTALTSVRTGLFGMAGLRDPHLVQHADGTPYVRDGLLYLTATCAGLGFFQQAHWGVFTLDLARPDRLDQVAHLFFSRDGLLLGDHAGQVVRDDERDEWIVATSSWGDFPADGVHVRHTRTRADVLHGVHVLETERTPLPTSQSSWDPGVTRIDGRWYVSFVESPSQDPFDFHPALASTGADEWSSDLRLVGADTSLHQCEGPVIARRDGAWWLLASDGDARHYPVYTLGMTRVGRLDAPYPTNIPHPQLVLLPSGEDFMISFDGTQYGHQVLGYGGHGDIVLMRPRS